MNIVDYVFRQDPTRTAIITPTETITYGELKEVVSRCANKLRTLKSLTSVLLVDQNSKEQVILFFAAIACGLQAGFSSDVHSKADTMCLVDNVKPSLVLKGSALARFINSAQNHSAHFTPVQVAPDHLCYFTTSSGTTGSSLKVSYHTHIHLLHNATVGTAQIVSGDNHVYYGVSPYAFSFGPPSLILSPLLNGHAVVINQVKSIKDIVDCISEYNVTALFSSVAFYKEATKMPDVKERLSSLQHAVTAGEYAPPEMRQRWEAVTGKYLTVVIGLADTSWFYAYSVKGVTPLTSVGVISSGYGVSVLSDGVCVVRTPANKLVNTGDTVTYTDGILTFEGRNTDVITSRGMKIMPEEVETTILLNTTNIQEVQVVPYHRLGHSMVCAVVVLKSSATASATRREVKSAVAGLPKHKQPSAVFVVNSLAKTFSGKPKRKTTQEIINGTI